MAAEEAYHTASDGCKIFYRTWRPRCERPKGVVQVHHGGSDHSGRYVEFAGRLNQAGFVVVVHDSRGNGRTGAAEGAAGLGIVPCGAEGPAERMVMDFTELLHKTHAEYPDLPLIVFGHSFGTIVSQLCVGAGAGGLIVRGLLLSAPPARPPPMAKPFFRATFALLHCFYGDSGFSKVPDMLSFDKYNAKAIAEGGHQGPVTGKEWVNRDDAEVAKLVADPYAGNDLSVGLWAAMPAALARVSSTATYTKLPPGIRVGVMQGTGDYSGVIDCGKPARDSIREELAGRAEPEVFVYEGARHDLFLELNKESVYGDILRFMSACVERRGAAS